MTLAIEGDPGSCSQAGGSLRRLASQLRSATQRVQAAGSEAETWWTGRAARAAGHSRETLEQSATAVATELDRAGSLLQEHSSDLAEAIQTMRAVTERAQAAGLRVVDGTVVPSLGVTGLADRDADSDREQVAARLQGELDHVTLQLRRRRARLVAGLDTARLALAAHSGTLHR